MPSGCLYLKRRQKVVFPKRPGVRKMAFGDGSSFKDSVNEEIFFSFLDSMMPWSVEYRNYEEKQKNTEEYQKWLYYQKAGGKDFQQKDTIISWHALLKGREVWYTVGGGVWVKQ